MCLTYLPIGMKKYGMVIHIIFYNVVSLKLQMTCHPTVPKIWDR